MSNLKKVISPPLDFATIIAETTQSRQVLRINLNKLDEVKPLSAFSQLLIYVNYFFLGFSVLVVLICYENMTKIGAGDWGSYITVIPSHLSFNSRAFSKLAIASSSNPKCANAIPRLCQISGSSGCNSKAS